MLEHRTKLFGRSGKICGDTLQKSFLEWTYAKFEPRMLKCHPLSITSMGQQDTILQKEDVVPVSGRLPERLPTSLPAN
ncbi:hypothetical protein KUCAC02_032989 [Chaenocephalus aceratus]|nr:hypothetical protein KUCAC02_032989 [Chaenocephalus aceratus]